MVILVLVLVGFFLFMFTIYKVSLFIWPDQKKCGWELREDEEREWLQSNPN